jgi:hypothetical protein
LKVDGETITIKHCEVLQHPPLAPAGSSNKGCFYGELQHAAATDVYTLSKNSDVNGKWLQPEFTIHGFRYPPPRALNQLFYQSSSLCWQARINHLLVNHLLTDESIYHTTTLLAGMPRSPG